MNNKNFSAPARAKKAVWYQIFPERFCNGDPNNDPTLESIRSAYLHDLTSPWQIHPWNSDWYAVQPYESVKFYPHLSEELIRVVLIHPGEVILPELGEKLGHYAQKN